MRSPCGPLATPPPGLHFIAKDATRGAGSGASERGLTLVNDCRQPFDSSFLEAVKLWRGWGRRGLPGIARAAGGGEMIPDVHKLSERKGGEMVFGEHDSRQLASGLDALPVPVLAQSGFRRLCGGLIASTAVELLLLAGPEPQAASANDNSINSVLQSESESGFTFATST